MIFLSFKFVPIVYFLQQMNAYLNKEPEILGEMISVDTMTFQFL